MNPRSFIISSSMSSKISLSSRCSAATPVPSPGLPIEPPSVNLRHEHRHGVRPPLLPESKPWLCPGKPLTAKMGLSTLQQVVTRRYRDGAVQYGLLLRGREFRNATQHAAEVLTKSLVTTEAAMDQLRDQIPVIEVLRSIPASEVVEELATALDERERAQHAFRVALIGAAVKEGTSISEVARVYGISRQHAQRYAKEAREQ